MSEYSFELTPSVEIALEPLGEGSLRVTIAETDDGYRVVYSSVETVDFASSTQKRGTIANKLTEHLSPHLNADAVKKEFDSFCSRLDADALDEDTEAMFRGPAVQQLLDETRKVEVFGGEPTTVTVHLEHDGEERPITFTAAEWVQPDPTKLKTRYYERFFEKLDLTKDEWLELTDTWDELKEVVDVEEMTETDAVVNRVVTGLKRRLDAYDTRDALENGPYSAWFDEGNTAADTTCPPDANVLWVQSAAVTAEIEEAGKSTAYISELSKALKAEGYTYGSSKKKRKTRVYPFSAEALNVSVMDVFTDDEDTSGQSEVEP